MAAFGVGQVAEGIKNQAFNVFLIYYYQQVLGLSGTLTGLALAIALAVDAVSDPFAGLISDRTRSKWGRRHPYIVAAAIPLGLSFVALFNPPESLGDMGLFLWLMSFAIFVRISLTFYHVPHLALGAEIAQDYHQRSTLFSFSSLASIGAMSLVSVVGFRYFFPTTPEFEPGILNKAAYLDFSIAFGAVAALSILLCAVGTAGEIKHLKPLAAQSALTLKNSWGQFRAVFRNRNFIALFLGMVLAAMSLTVEAQLGAYSGVHFWGLTTEQLSQLPIATLAGLLVGTFAVPTLTRWLDKKRALIIPASIAVLLGNVVIVSRLLELGWLPANGSQELMSVLLTRAFLAALCYPIVFASLNSMFADVADEMELETGERREGVIYATRSFSTKATASIGALMTGISLDLIAFPNNAAVGTVPADVVWRLGLIEGPIASAFTLTGILLYSFYGLNRERHNEIRRQLLQRDSVPH